MESKFKFLIIFFSIIPVVFLFIWGLFIPSDNCNLLLDFKKSNFKGIILNKYYDQKNHRTKTLIIKINDKNAKLILPNDTSRFFDFIIVGDTVLKQKSTDFIGVYRKDSLKEFKIYFGCYD